MHFITLVALVTLVEPHLELLRIPLGAFLGPPRRAMRALEVIMHQNPSQIKPDPGKIEPNPKPKSKPNPAQIQNPNPNQNPNPDPKQNPRRITAESWCLTMVRNPSEVILSS